MPTPRQTAEAFSTHRFEETYNHLDDDVHWVAVGQTVLKGRDAVIRACTGTATDLATTTTEFLRFVTVVDLGASADQRVAVDAVAQIGASCVVRYVNGPMARGGVPSARSGVAWESWVSAVRIVSPSIAQRS